MPYHVGSKGSNGCSGYPVVSDSGKVMGCHPTESNAQEQVTALYASGAADKSDTPMDVAYNPTVTDPIAATPNGIGMKRPQYMLNQPRQTQPKKIHNKPGVDIWSGSAFGKSECCSEELEKQSPCWDGYVQRGMKSGANGKMVPNCVPVEKSEDNPILPTSTYQHCECEICVDQNLKCSNCPECQSGMDAEMEMAAYDASLGKTLFNFDNSAKLVTKQTIRWDK
jgi:hypothetical protein